MLDYITAHWPEWAVGSAVAVTVWLITNTVGRPLVSFWSDRREALRVVQQHGIVGDVSLERAREAAIAIRSAAAAINVYAQSGPWIITTYCLLRGYNLQIAGGALNGLHHLVGNNYSDDDFRNQCDAVRVSLGATRGLPNERVQEILRMIDSAAM